MLIVLTDVLACPRCGPDFGLIVLADRLENRRVLEGVLGCANCREAFPIRDGIADLRYPPAEDAPRAQAPPAAPPDDDEAAFRLAALLGVTGGPGLILVAGRDAALASAIARLVPEVGVVAVAAEPAAAPGVAAGDPAVSRVLASARLPFRSRSVRAAALTGAAAEPVEEGARLVAAGGRLVLDPAPAGAASRLRDAGFTVLLEQDEIVVATAPPGR